jgi:hypothetical protein
LFFSRIGLSVWALLLGLEVHRPGLSFRGSSFLHPPARPFLPSFTSVPPNFLLLPVHFCLVPALSPRKFAPRSSRRPLFSLGFPLAFRLKTLFLNGASFSFKRSSFHRDSFAFIQMAARQALFFRSADPSSFFSPSLPTTLPLLSFPRLLPVLPSFSTSVPFHSPFKVLFIFPSQYFFSIGLSALFPCLAGSLLYPACSRSIPNERDSSRRGLSARLRPWLRPWSTRLSRSLAEASTSLPHVFARQLSHPAAPTVHPDVPSPGRQLRLWALSASLAVTTNITVVFFSLGLLKCFSSPGFLESRQGGFLIKFFS